MTRALAALAILVLGALAASHVEVTYLPERTFPEVRVSLQLNEAHDVGELTRRWLQPLESAIRAAGAVTSTAGEVGPRGATMRVRFDPAVDARSKAARLDSELASLGRELVDHGSIRVDPVVQGGGERSSVLFLQDQTEDDVRSLVESLRDAPEVRGVDVAGRTRRELRWTTGRVADLALLRQALAESDIELGSLHARGRRLPVRVASSGDVTAAERWVATSGRVVRFGSLATPERRLRDGEFMARFGGRPGLVLLVSRDSTTSPLALERVLRSELSRAGFVVSETSDRVAARDVGASSDAPRAIFLWSEAEPIEFLLRRLALGALWALLAGSFVAAVFLGWRACLWQAAAVPLAVATAAIVFRLLDLPLDVTTAQAAVLALGGALVFQTSRLAGKSTFGSTAPAWTVLCVLAMPVAVHLLGRDLATLLSQPVKVFATVLPSCVLSLLILPTSRMPPREFCEEGARRIVRFVLRQPWGVTLLALTVGYGTFAVFSDRLQPRPGRLLPVAADVTVQVNLGEGGTLQQAARWIETVEQHLLSQNAVSSVWGYHDRESAYLLVTVREEDREPRDLRRLAMRWHSQLTALGSSVRVNALGGLGQTEPLRFDSSLRTRAEIDEEITFYRFVLRSADVERLRWAERRIRDDVNKTWWGRRYDRVQTEWTKPTPRLELIPRQGVSTDEVDTARLLLAERVALPGGRQVAAHGAADQPVLQSVVSASARRLRPSDDARRQAPQLAQVLAPGSGGSAVAIAPAETFRLRESLGSPTVRREDGAFVLPMTVRFIGLPKGEVINVRDSAHHVVGRFASPAVDVERPSLIPHHWTEQRLRLLSVASALPLLLFVLAAIRLDSLPLALAAMVPLVAAVGTTAATLAVLDLRLDETTLLALAAALASTMPLVLETAQAVRVRTLGRLSASAGFDWLVQHLPHAAVSLSGWLTLLVGVGWGLAGERHPWAPPLRVAGITGGVVVLGALLVLPGLLRAVDRLRFYDRAEAERQARPPEWRAEGPPALQVRRLTKIYGNGFRALHGVSFRLDPGIVGLLGPNGAGKTTLLRSLCGLLEPSRGRVLYRGVAVKPENLAEYRRIVGFLPQDFDAYEGFTAADFLDYWALQRGIANPKERRRETEELLDLVGLSDVADRKVRDFSGGMRRRIGIARSLLGAPPILIVDEPTTGLDVESRNRLRESLLAAAGNRVIIFSTHIASDVAAAASRILLLNRGRLIFDGPSGELIAEAHGRVFEAVVDDEELRGFAETYRVTTRLRTLDGVKVRAVAAKDQEPAGEIVRPNLEEAYLAKLGTTAQKRSRVKSLLEL
ncbi:MAG: ATP-binding cassette domain-containing protein [Thermoanaerobaculia bacterium]|nr:ATP-binding cassette domain-containing protein [Thermoanaerobaculia bacterium]